MSTTAGTDQGQPQYRGRFAPSPTGLLHLGSLFSAVASFLRARASGGQWLVRIEDIDPPREIPDAGGDILRQLEAAGLFWDGAVVVQSTRRNVYRACARELLRNGLAYPCSCSRREIAAHPQSGAHGMRYPGTCRVDRNTSGRRNSLRVRAPEQPVRFHDTLQGDQCIDIDATVGDFVIWRKEDLPAYHLAVVIDDAWQQISEVVRGIDLLSSTGPHIHLQRLCNLPTPDYLHLPVLVDRHGNKLSKQNQAPVLAPADMPAAVARCLQWLGWHQPQELVGAPAVELLQAAQSLGDFPRLTAVSALAAD